MKLIQDRLTAKEAMAHVYFAPIRAAEEAAAMQQSGAQNANSTHT